MNIRREQSDYAPHECTECGEAAYVPFHGMARCTNWKCARFDQTIWEEHVMSLPDTGDPDIEDDEPTQPQGLAAWLPDPKVKWQGTITGRFLSSPTSIDEIPDLKMQDLDSLIHKALGRCMAANTGSALKVARDEHRKLLDIKREVHETIGKVHRAIDKTVPLCYTWDDDGSEQGS